MKYFLIPFCVGIVVLITMMTVQQLASNRQLTQEEIDKIPAKYHVQRKAEAEPVIPSRFERIGLTDVNKVSGWPPQYVYIIRDTKLDKCILVIQATNNGNKVISQTMERCE